MMSAGYTQKSAHKLVSNVIENKNYISEVIYVTDYSAQLWRSAKRWLG